MDNLVEYKPWLQELRNELNEALLEYVDQPLTLARRGLMYMTIDNIVDKYRHNGYIDSNFNVFSCLDFNRLKYGNNKEI